MKRLQCTNPNCKATFEVDEKNVDKKLKYMACPVCNEVQLNPFYKEK